MMFAALFDRGAPGRRVSPVWLMRSTAFAICLFANANQVPARAAQVESDIEVSAMFQKTFAVSGKTTLTPGPPRQSPIGSDPTGAGEITIGLAPPGGAVGVAKLHVFERTAVAVGFTATAFQGPDAIATAKVCGRLDMDAWVGLPAETTSIRVFAFVPVKGACK